MSVTTDGAALRRAICEGPADDLPRYLYADWLEEQGDPWASFVRGMLRLPGSIRMVIRQSGGLMRPAEEFWHPHIDPPIGLCPIWAKGIGLRRGFVAEVYCTALAFMEHAAELFASQPVTKVVLTDRAPELSSRYGKPTNWRWYVTGSRPSRMPRELWPILANVSLGPNAPPTESIIFRGATEAHSTLSLACVAYGRKKAGLPPLKSRRSSATDTFVTVSLSATVIHSHVQAREWRKRSARSDSDSPATSS